MCFFNFSRYCPIALQRVVIYTFTINEESSLSNCFLKERDYSTFPAFLFNICIERNYLNAEI